MYVLFIHPLVDLGLIIFFVRLLSIVLKQTQEYNYHFGILIVHTPVVGQLDYKLALFLIFLRDSHIAFHNGFSLHFYP